MGSEQVNSNDKFRFLPEYTGNTRSAPDLAVKSSLVHGTPKITIIVQYRIVRNQYKISEQTNYITIENNALTVCNCKKVEKSLIVRIFAKCTCIFKGDAESSDTEHFIGTWSVWDQSQAVSY